MINQYKRCDVFRCKLQSHDSFAGRVSVHHVLKVKRCLPDGCFYFHWRCRLLEKGGTCKKGYNFVGRNCTGCRFHYDIKEHKIPVRLLAEKEHEKFLRELEEFEQWLHDNLDRRLEVLGTVNHVGPLLSRDIYPRESRLSLHGWLINFAECYLGWTHFEDYVYLRLSRRSQQELRLGRGDKIEFEAELGLDEGRLVLTRPGRFEFRERAPERQAPEEGRELAAARAAAELESQSETCLRCERGRLVDVTEHDPRFGRRGFSRRLFCLEGVTDPALCCYRAFRELETPEDGNCVTRS